MFHETLGERSDLGGEPRPGKGPVDLFSGERAKRRGCEAQGVRSAGGAKRRGCEAQGVRSALPMGEVRALPGDAGLWSTFFAKSCCTLQQVFLSFTFLRRLVKVGKGPEFCQLRKLKWVRKEIH